MSRYIVRRKSSQRGKPQPAAAALTRLSSATFSPFARIKNDDGSFTSFSEINEQSPISTELRKRNTLVIDADQRAIERLREESTNEYHVESAIEYYKATPPFDLFRAAPLDLVKMLREEPLNISSAGAGKDITVHVQGSGGRAYENLPYAQVHVFLGASGKVRDHLQLRTDEEGTASFQIASWYSVLAIVAYPYAYHAPAVLRGDPGSRARLLCKRLPRAGDGAMSWWHEAVGATEYELGRGKGRAIRVGVIDSGCGPHPALEHVSQLGAYIDGGYYPGGGADSGAHGTHVCGTIGGRPIMAGPRFRGVATGVELFSARVFPEDAGANQGDIADALDALVDRDVDLVNMSLGSSKASEILLDAVENAYNEGTVCVCAAGNESGPVSYPAALDKTIAVSALGKSGEVDASSLPALPNNPELFGSKGYYAADFTNFGPEVSMIAPGVGIIATVPERFGMEAPYVMMNGTSMASPIATGALAAILGRSKDYMDMVAKRERSRYVRSIAAVVSNSIELPNHYEGRGLANVQTQWIK